MNITELKNIIHAIILSTTEPVTIAKLKEILKDNTNEQIKEALSQLLKQKHPVHELVKIADSYRFQIKAKYAVWISSLQKQPTEKLSTAHLETLAIIAYKQPVTRGEIETIRGASLNLNILAQLEDRNLIKNVGYTGVNRRAILYGTTKEFLLYFGLNSVHELPEVEEIVTS